MGNVGARLREWRKLDIYYIYIQVNIQVLETLGCLVETFLSALLHQTKYKLGFKI